MVIGIVGSGKMGQDILKYFMDQETGIVLVCRSQEKREKLKESIGKQLRRKLKRGMITEEQYEEKMQNIQIAEEYQALAGCDLVIETVIEDVSVKKEVMRKVEEVVGENCIIATNTSSIKLEQIFADTKKRQRCLGLHFFYPVKITGYVEINCTDTVSDGVVEQVKEALKQLQIKEITLHGEGNMIINKIITTIVSFANEIHREGKLRYAEIDELIKQEIMMFGAFELVDSTGFYIILKSLHNFEHNFNDRYHRMYQVVEEEMHRVMGDGCLGGPQTGGFLKSEQDKEDILADETYLKEVPDRIKAVLLNDMAFYCNQGVVEAEEIFDALYAVLGFNKHPKEMFAQMGKERIMKLLEEESAKEHNSVYKVEDFACYE